MLRFSHILPNSAPGHGGSSRLEGHGKRRYKKAISHDVAWRRSCLSSTSPLLFVSSLAGINLWTKFVIVSLSHHYEMKTVFSLVAGVYSAMAAEAAAVVASPAPSIPARATQRYHLRALRVQVTARDLQESSFDSSTGYAYLSTGMIAWYCFVAICSLVTICCCLCCWGWRTRERQRQSEAERRAAQEEQANVDISRIERNVKVFAENEHQRRKQSIRKTMKRKIKVCMCGAAGFGL